MNNPSSNKGSVNIILVIIIVLLLGTVGYLATRTPSPLPAPANEAPDYNANENKIISDLLSSWVATQAKFAIKASESGTYNQPNKVQFIASTTLLVHYDDGLVDHISVLRYQNGTLTELKNVGVMSTMPQDAWQALVDVYGDSKYPVGSYTTNVFRNGKGIEYPELTKVPENIFVR
ncbi:MAG: hypothetical protein LiPW15_713 [Parcubacteria group bacterium LiPW_15]|nr:MAG: hypothetical protein LiPW15_713 [Parcubacteria group bacterium LiPW_15]